MCVCVCLCVCVCVCVNVAKLACTHACRMWLCEYDCVPCVCDFAACQASLLPLVNKTCPSVAGGLFCLSFLCEWSLCFSALMTEEGEMRRGKHYSYNTLYKLWRLWELPRFPLKVVLIRFHGSWRFRVLTKGVCVCVQCTRACVCVCVCVFEGTCVLSVFCGWGGTWYVLHIKERSDSNTAPG